MGGTDGQVDGWDRWDRWTDVNRWTDMNRWNRWIDRRDRET